MATFDYQFYTLSGNDHPCNRHSRSEDLNNILQWYLDSLDNKAGEHFSCIISWVGDDGENASIRNDSFIFKPKGFTTCLEHPEEPGVLRDFYQLMEDRGYYFSSARQKQWAE